jgi:hypothetical protein
VLAELGDVAVIIEAESLTHARLRAAVDRLCRADCSTREFQSIPSSQVGADRFYWVETLLRRHVRFI